MKNRGYALSAIVYPLLLVCLVLILSILFNLNNKKNLLNSLKDEVKNEVAFVNKIPTAPIITGGSTNWSSSAKTISVSKPSTAMSGINNYQYCIGTSTNGCDGTWTDLASGTTSASISTNGIRYIYFRAISKSGREGQSSLYQTTMIDTEGPSIPTTGAIGNVSGSNTTGTIQTEASGSIDAGVGEITYLYLITNTNTTPSKNDTGFTTSKTFTRSCGTTYYAWAIAEDALGNRSEVKSLGSTSDGANSYSGWGSCSKSCGTGSQTRTNTCALVTSGLSQSCNTQSCCSKTTYKDTNGAWGSCSKACGTGSQSYTVTRTYYSAYDGSYCSQSIGVVTNTQACNTQSCNYAATLTQETYGATITCSGNRKLSGTDCVYSYGVDENASCGTEEYTCEVCTETEYNWDFTCDNGDTCSSTTGGQVEYCCLDIDGSYGTQDNYWAACTGWGDGTCTRYKACTLTENNYRNITCPNGGTLSGTTCQKSVYSCPNGGTLNTSNNMCEF